MRILKNYYTNVILLLFLCSLGLTVSISYADDEAEIELNASIMEIDLENEVMVVAEKDVLLLSHMVKGKKEWKTEFMDEQGRAISPEEFRQRDRVLVRGEENDSGAIEALKIIRLPENIPTKSKHSGRKSRERERDDSVPSNLRLEGGVWKN